MSTRISAPITADGVPARMRILAGALLLLRLLSRGWRQVEDLATEAGLHRRVVYRHLAAMRHLGIRLERVRDRSTGREIYWHVPAGEIARWLGQVDTEEPPTVPRDD